MSQAQLTENWQRQHKALRAWLEASAAASRQESGGVWYRPYGEDGPWKGDLLDPGAKRGEGLSKPFLRKEYEDILKEALQAGGKPLTNGELQAVLFQVNTLAAMERAFRERHKSLPRAMAHAAARQNGTASAAGIWEKHFKEYAARLLKAAADDGASAAT